MLNLLPEQAKKELGLEKTSKKIALLLLFILIAFAFLTIVLSCLRISLASQIEDIKALASEQQTLLQSAQFQDFKETISQTNKNLGNVQDFQQRQLSTTDILKKLSQSRTADLLNSIYLTNFSLKKVYQEIKKKGEARETKIFTEINVGGWAQTRDDLFFLKQEIEKIPQFTELYFSPSSWVEPTDVEFTFSFKSYPQE